jgi:group II intron reverse transcriptase/maturase
VNVSRGKGPEIGVSLATPNRVQALQKALHAKAKGSPAARFHALYDKVFRADVLAHAYALCRSNGGAAGVDGQTFEDIEASGLGPWVDELAQRLRSKRYRPQSVRRVFIPKPDGTLRPLGIPTVTDRVVQTAVRLVLEAIFEADLPSEQYAYRPGRDAHGAVARVMELLEAGHQEVVDADLSGYFDSIPHAELMRSLARRIADGSVLHLIKMWLDAPVEESGSDGVCRRTTCNRDAGRGTPQGAPISPLLSNVYMRRFVSGWKQLGYARRFRAEIVNYADDFVICCRGSAEEALTAMRDMMSQLKLAVNERKTHVCKLPEDRFDFLGYTFGRLFSPRTGRDYLAPVPATKKVRSVCRVVSEMTARRWTQTAVGDCVAGLNQVLVGWANYFSLGTVSPAYRAIDQHVARRVRQWLCDKFGVRGRGTKRFSDDYLYRDLGLVQLTKRRGNIPWARA